MKQELKNEIIREIRKNYWKPKKGYLNVRALQKNPELCEILKKETSFLSEEAKYIERFYCFENNITQQPICYNPKCNNPVSFSKGHYNHYCSDICFNETRKLSFEERINLLDLDSILSYNKEEGKEQIQKYINPNGKLNKGISNNLGLPNFDLSLAKFVWEQTKNYSKNISIRIRLYNILNNIKEIPKCICGNNRKLLSFKEGYSPYCSLKCAANNNHDKRKETNLKKYGVENPFQSEEIKKKIKQTNLKKYGVENPSQAKEIKEKKKETYLKHWGVENNFLCEETKEKRKQTYLKNWGVDHPFKLTEFQEYLEYRRFLKLGTTTPMQVPELKQQIIETNMKNHGGVHSLALGLDTGERQKKIEEGMKKSYGVKYYNQSQDYKIKLPEIQEKIKKTNMFKLGVPYSSQSSEIQQKIYNTKKKNNTFHTSNLESDLYDYFSQFYYIERHKQIPNSTLNCDYYIPELDLWIELQGTWTHGGCAFNSKNKDHIKKLREWESKNTKYYQNAINVWTQRDPYKRVLMKEKGLRYLEIFDYEDFENVLIQIDRVVNGLFLNYNPDFLYKEYNRILNKKGKYRAIPSNNYVIDFFQQNIFFRKENEIYKNDPILRRKLIENRVFYKNKKEKDLTNKELLSGFKISHIYHSYSYFSPLWIKEFIENYNIKSLYDPCGGWGQRILGASDITYIYNDIDNEVVHNIKRMIKFFNLSNKTIIYNRDASEFSPKENYEAVFTCPPYYNTEKYSSKSSEQVYSNYENWLNLWWDKLIKQSTRNGKIKYFVFVIDSQHKEDMKKIVLRNNYKLLEENILGVTSSNVAEDNIRKNREYILIFQKNLIN